MPNKVQDFEVSDTTGDDIYSAARPKKSYASQKNLNHIY
jgi:hypothetical protein